jgi:hypothetical protein
LKAWKKTVATDDSIIVRPIKAHTKQQIVKYVQSNKDEQITLGMRQTYGEGLLALAR